MGMNIYTIRQKPIKEWDSFNDKHILNYEDKHIGKRYAAGIWCWDCKVPLFDKDRTETIAGLQMPIQLDKCPSCGKQREETAYNPAMRELGFDKSKPKKHTGIDGASGFIWCIDPHYGLGSSKEEVLKALQGKRSVIDEYGRKMSMKAFNEMFLDVIEEQFVSGEFS